jgi:hypothetical protein
MCTNFVKFSQMATSAGAVKLIIIFVYWRHTDASILDECVHNFQGCHYGDVIFFSFKFLIIVKENLNMVYKFLTGDPYIFYK